MIYTDVHQLADRHVTQMLAILDIIGKRGIRVDFCGKPDDALRDKECCRWHTFKDTMRQELDGIQSSLDANDALKPLRGWHPKEGYKRTPKDLKGLKLTNFTVTELPKESKGLERRIHVERWARPKPFNPGSEKQVKAYMRSRGHKVPTTRKGDETTAGNTLLLHWRKYGDPLYKEFVEYRKVAKLLNTYGAWPLTVRDGVRYATTKFTLRPDTNRLSSTKPNIQNIPKKGKYAKRFRRTLIASPGCVLLRADLASAEALVFAWLCGDPLMMRLARLGMHNFAMTKKLGIPVDLNEPDDTLKQRFSELKDKNKELYNIIKVCVYGSLYLAGARTLYEKNPEDFGSQREAKKFQRVVFDAIPQIRVFQEGICQKRFTYGAQGRNWGWSGNRLYNPFGYCPTPNCKILTADLRWVEAGSLKAGDALVGVEEHPEPGYKKRRKFKTSYVTSTVRDYATVYRVKFSDGTESTVTAEHPWLVERLGAQREHNSKSHWIATSALEIGDTVKKVFSVWREETDRDSGYLAGFFDGEGHTSFSGGTLSVGAAQKENVVLETVCEILGRKGFKYTLHKGKNGVTNLVVNGGKADTIRFLGSVRPRRLLKKFRPEMLHTIAAHSDKVVVSSVTFEGRREIVRLSTSTSTYILDGFISHNSKEFWDISGSDGPGACAFLPQSIIACIMKESMLDLWEYPVAQKHMIWQIHDELVFDAPIHCLPMLGALVQQVMGQSWPQLGGLSIGVEVKESEDMS